MYPYSGIDGFPPILIQTISWPCHQPLFCVYDNNRSHPTETRFEQPTGRFSKTSGFCTPKRYFSLKTYTRTWLAVGQEPRSWTSGSPSKP